MMLPEDLVAPHRGRPPKFGRPAQPVTITLPDDIVQALRAVDPDLSRAIVRLAETSGAALVPRPAVELTHYGHSAVIVVARERAVERLAGVELVPLPDGRALISLDQETGVAEFEVRVRDALDAGSASASERIVLEALGEILRTARRSRKVNLQQRGIIVLASRKAGHTHPTRRGASRGGLTT
jgi:hypothetical protein